MIPDTPPTELLKGAKSVVKIVQVNLYDFNWFLKLDEFRSINKISQKELKKAAEITQKAKEQAFSAKVATDAIKNGQWQKLGKGGAAFLKIANLASVVAGILGYILGIKNANDIQSMQDISVNIWQAQASEFERNLRLLKKQDTRIQKVENKVKAIDKDNTNIGLKAQQAFTNSVKARELGNNALYEARQGRVKLEAKINDVQVGANKLIADANAKIFTINKQVESLFNQVKNNAQATIQNTVNQIQDRLKSQQSQINNQGIQVNNLGNQIKQISGKLQQPQQQQINEQKITSIASNAAVAAVRPAIQEIRSENQTIKIDLESLDRAYNISQNANEIKDNALSAQDKVLAGAISTLANELNGLKTKTYSLNNLNLIDAEARRQIEQLKNVDKTQQQKINQIETQVQQQQK